MKHFTHPSFWDYYNNLPASVRKLADNIFELLKLNPKHPSLHLKKLEKYWSIRIGKKHRALAIEEDNALIWFWIGTHSEYDKLIKR